MSVIDYALVRHVHATRCAIAGRHGSDHELVIFELSNPLTPLVPPVRVGLWNVRRDRELVDVVRQVHKLANLVDVLLLVEAHDYVPALRRQAERLHVRAWSDEPGQDQCIVVTRADYAHRLSSSWCRRMTWRGWFPAHSDRETAPKYLTTVLVDGWLRLAVGHLPPSVRWPHPERRRSLPTGPARRVAAYVVWIRSARRFFRRRPADAAVAMFADWNEPPTTAGRWSPRWLARKVGASIIAPRESTHGRR